MSQGLIFLKCFFFIKRRIFALFPPFVIILAYNWDALGTKSVSLSVHQTIGMNSGNIEPQNIDDGILVDRQGIRTIKKGNLFLLSKSLYTNILSSIVKNVACSPWCSSFSSNCFGEIYLYEEENSPSSFVVQRSSMNLDVPWNL